jgi:hypothetical protein
MPSPTLKMKTLRFSETMVLPATLHGAETRKIIIIIIVLTVVKTSNMT